MSTTLLTQPEALALVDRMIADLRRFASLHGRVILADTDRLRATLVALFEDAERRTTPPAPSRESLDEAYRDNVLDLIWRKYGGDSDAYNWALAFVHTINADAELARSVGGEAIVWAEDTQHGRAYRFSDEGMRMFGHVTFGELSDAKNRPPGGLVGELRELSAELKGYENECRSTYPIVANTYEQCRSRIDAIIARHANKEPT